MIGTYRPRTMAGAAWEVEGIARSVRTYSRRSRFARSKWNGRVRFLAAGSLGLDLGSGHGLPSREWWSRSDRSRWSCPVGMANPHPMLFHDPEATRQRLSFQQVEDGGEDSNHVGTALVREPEHDQSWIVLWGILANVGEFEVERDDRSALDPTDFAQTSIRVAPHSLVMNSQCVVTSRPKGFCDLDMKVFIHLESHHAAPGTKGMIRSRANSAA